MDVDVTWIVVGAVGLVVAVWFVPAFFVRVTGTWQRAEPDGTGPASERLTLVQFGPLVRGRRMLQGGFQEYTGFLRGRTLRLARRDHGVALIAAQGFPDPVARQIDGTVTARLRLTLSADGRALFGEFHPQKIEFTHRPPELLARRYLPPVDRRYVRLSHELLEEPVATGARPESAPRPPVAKTV